VAEVTTKKRDRYRSEREIQLDHVLKKVSQVGVEHLSPEDVAFLDRVAAELRYEMGITPDKPDYDLIV
jgi:hypothetical protein